MSNWKIRWDQTTHRRFCMAPRSESIATLSDIHASAKLVQSEGPPSFDPMYGKTVNSSSMLQWRIVSFAKAVGSLWSVSGY